MKKNVLKIALFAFGLCSATALTSCHNGEDVDIVEVAQLEARTLVVHTNVAAAVDVNGVTKTTTAILGGGFEATFENPDVTGKILVGPASRQKKINYDFKDGAMLYYDVTVEAAGTVYSQAAVETGGATVSNGTANQGDNDGVEASFALNGETNNGTTGDYSITVYDPAAASTNAEDLAQGQTYLEAPLAIDCKPDGANFSNPIKVKLNIPGSGEFAVKVKSGDEEATVNQTGDLVEANIPHFSIWEIVLNVKLESIDTQVNKIVDTTVNAKSGKYGFKFDYGYSCDQASNSTLIKNLLKAMFGSKKKKVNKNITWTSTEGSATVTVNQEVKTYKFVSGNKVFYVTTYGKITSSVVVNPAEETPTHGGGSN